MAQANLLMKRGKARRLGVEGYRQMNETQLDAALAKASAPAPTKGKTAAATVAPAKGKTATAAPAKGKVSTVPSKGKTASTTAPTKGKTTTAPAAKSTRQKSSPPATAAKGKVTRQSASPVKTTARKAPVKTVRKVATKAPVKTTAANGYVSKEKGNRVGLEKKQIDWKAESNVGRTGKRSEVLAALRKYRGDYGKVFDALAGNWKRYYPTHSKVAAQKLLKWLIARVAYDFAMDTQQHERGVRRAYGTAGTTNGSTTKPKATKAVAKATGRKAATAKKTPVRGTTAPTTRKPAQRRAAAPAAKRGGKVTSGRR